MGDISQGLMAFLGGGAAPAPLSSTSNSGLPFGWEAIEGADGATYYYNSNTGETAWDPPGNENNSAGGNSAGD